MAGPKRLWQAQDSKKGSKSVTLNPKQVSLKLFKFIELNFPTSYLLYGSAAEISCSDFSVANLLLSSGHLIIFPEHVQFKGHPSFWEGLINRIGHPLCSSCGIHERFSSPLISSHLKPKRPGCSVWYLTSSCALRGKFITSWASPSEISFFQDWIFSSFSLPLTSPGWL